MDYTYFLPSEVARLVLGYLKESNYVNTYKSFLRECPHLSECYSLMKHGREIRTSIMGLGLLSILEEYGELKLQDVSAMKGTNSTKTLWKQFDLIVGHLRRQVNQSKSVIQGKPQNSRTRRSVFWTQTPTVPTESESHCIRTLLDQPSQVLSPDVHSQYEATELEDTSHVNSEDNVSARKVVEESLNSSIHEESLQICDKQGNDNIEADVISTGKESPNKVKTKNPRKTHETDSAILQREAIRETSVRNLTRSGDVCVDRNNSQVERGTTVEKLSQSVAEQSKLCSNVSRQDQTSSRDRLDTIPDIHTTSTETEIDNDRLAQRQKSAEDKEKRVETMLFSPKSTYIGTAVCRNDAVTPAKDTHSFKRPSEVTPVKLFQHNEDSRSPRRKKPKTPRKRTYLTDGSSAATATVTPNVDNQEPIFQKILSDKRLHEKLAETCNLVTEKAKASHPPTSLQSTAMANEAYTASKSLEEILNADTHLGPDLSDNIDMSDPVFESLFKLFGTDKDAFADSQRIKEQQETIQELEKSIHEIETLNAMEAQQSENCGSPASHQSYPMFGMLNSTESHTASSATTPLHCSSPVSKHGPNSQSDQCYSPGNQTQPFSPIAMLESNPNSPAADQQHNHIYSDDGSHSHPSSPINGDQNPMVVASSPAANQEHFKSPVTPLTYPNTPSMSRRHLPLPMSPLVTQDIQPSSPIMTQKTSVSTSHGRGGVCSTDNRKNMKSCESSVSVVLSSTKPYSPGTQKNAHLMIQSDLSNTLPPVVSEVEVECSQSPVYMNQQLVNYSNFVSDVQLSDSSTPLPGSRGLNVNRCVTAADRQRQTVDRPSSGTGDASNWASKLLMPPTSRETSTSLARRDKTTSSSAGSRAGKDTTGGFSTLKGLLTKQPMSSTPVQPSDNGVQAISMPVLIGNTDYTDTVSYTEDNTNNNSLMILSPGGSNMMEVPILACHDVNEEDVNSVGGTNSSTSQMDCTVWSNDNNSCVKLQVLPGPSPNTGTKLGEISIVSENGAALSVGQGDSGTQQSWSNKSEVQPKVPQSKHTAHTKAQAKEMATASNKRAKKSFEIVQDEGKEGDTNKNFTGYFNSPAIKKCSPFVNNSDKTKDYLFKQSIHVRSLDFGSKNIRSLNGMVSYPQETRNRPIMPKDGVDSPESPGKNIWQLFPNRQIINLSPDSTTGPVTIVVPGDISSLGPVHRTVQSEHAVDTTLKSSLEPDNIVGNVITNEPVEISTNKSKGKAQAQQNIRQAKQTPKVKSSDSQPVKSLKDDSKKTRSRLKPIAKCTPLVPPTQSKCKKADSSLNESVSTAGDNRDKSKTSNKRVCVRVPSKKGLVKFNPSNGKNSKVTGQKTPPGKSSQGKHPKKPSVQERLSDSSKESLPEISTLEQPEPQLSLKHTEEKLKHTSPVRKTTAPAAKNKKPASKRPAVPRKRPATTKLKVKIDPPKKQSGKEKNTTRNYIIRKNMKQEEKVNNVIQPDETSPGQENRIEHNTPSKEQVLETLGLTPKKNEAALLEKLKSPPRQNMLDILASLCCSPPDRLTGKGYITPKKKTPSSSRGSQIKSAKKTPKRSLDRPVTPGRSLFPRINLTSPLKKSVAKIAASAASPVKAGPADKRISNLEKNSSSSPVKLSESVLKPVSPKVQQLEVTSADCVSPVSRVKLASERFPLLLQSLSPKTQERVTKGCDQHQPTGLQKRSLFKTGEMANIPVSKKRSLEKSQTESPDLDQSAKPKPSKKAKKSVDLSKLDVDKLLSKLYK